MKKVIQSSAAENKKLAMAWMAAGLAMLAVGCTTTKEPEVGLLGPRRVVPAPYTEPKASPQPATVAEPAVPEAVTPGIETPAVEAPVKLTPPEVKSAITTYKVKSGDSLWKIGWAHGVSDRELAEFNNMKVSDTLRIGKTLNIPPGGKYVPLTKRPLPKHAAAAPKKAGGGAQIATARKGGEPIPADGKYTVQKNDNLWTIARKFDVKSADIRTASSLKTDRLEIGQVLVIPQGTGTVAAVVGTETAPVLPATTGVGATPLEAATAPTGDMVTPPGAPVEPPAPTTGAGGAAEGGAKAPAAANTLPHVVVQNETLESIADMYDTKPEEILKANPQVKGNADLKPNMTLQIPFR